MKILVTGVSGLLGINFAQEAMTQQHEVIGADRGKLTNAPFRVLKADLTDPRGLDALFEKSQPDWVVNCVALADLDACESNPESARHLNVDLPAQLAKICWKRGLPFAHISTDSVFDGDKDGFYTEADKPNPLGMYPQTKWAGEKAVRDEHQRAIIARVNFYGWSLSRRRSLAEFFFNNLTEGKPMNGFTDVTFCPMLVNHTARILMRMLNLGLHGTYHLVGAQAMSKYQFGVELARKFGLDENLILPKSVFDAGLTARRSRNLRLSTAKLSADLGEALPHFSTGLDEFYAQHQQGYPRQIRSYQNIKE